ncbi:MAG: outer membrane beta-barrel protein [Holosporales bacterium]|nr:outer membrane beta-barrel protein [Holosporales bacterium]
MNSSIIIAVLFLGLCEAGCYVFASEDVGSEAELEAKAEEKANRRPEENEGEAPVSHDSSCGVLPSTGFYAGGEVGIDFASNWFREASTAEKDKIKKSKTGFTGGVFGGYNLQIGGLILSLECLIGMKPSKTETTIGTDSEKKEASLKRGCYFGVSPRIGYSLWSGGFGYLKFGTDFTKHRFTLTNASDGKETKKNGSKFQLKAAVGVEQHFARWFLRAECGKCFHRKVGDVDSIEAGTKSWMMAAGCGYRF